MLGVLNIIRNKADRSARNGVMNNYGFGQLTIKRPNGLIICVPQKCIKNDGTVRKTFKNFMSELTRETLESFESKGIKFFVEEQKEVSYGCGN